jgi:hypothetical protein
VTYGLVSSFLLFLLASYSVYKELLSQVGGVNKLIETIFSGLSEEGILLTLFVVSFSTLVYTFAGLSTNFAGQFSLVLQIVSWAVGVGATFELVRVASSNFDIQVTTSDFERVYEVANSTLITIIIGYAIYTTGYWAYDHVGAPVLLVEADISPIVPIIGAFCVGICSTGVVYLFAAVTIFLDGLGEMIDQLKARYED